MPGMFSGSQDWQKDRAEPWKWGLHPFQLPPALSTPQSPGLTQHEHPFNVAGPDLQMGKSGGKWNRENMGKHKRGKSNLHSGGLIGIVRWVIFLESKKSFLKLYLIQIQKVWVLGKSPKPMSVFEHLGRAKAGLNLFFLDVTENNPFPCVLSHLPVIHLLSKLSLSWTVGVQFILMFMAHSGVSKVKVSTLLGFIWDW